MNRFALIDSKNALDGLAPRNDLDGMVGNDQRSCIRVSMLRLLGEQSRSDDVRLIVVGVEVDGGSGWVDRCSDPVGEPLGSWLARREYPVDGRASKLRAGGR